MRRFFITLIFTGITSMLFSQSEISAEPMKLVTKALSHSAAPLVRKEGISPSEFREQKT